MELFIRSMVHSMEKEQIACKMDAFVRREQFKESYGGTHCKTLLKHLCLPLESQQKNTMGSNYNGMWLCMMVVALKLWQKLWKESSKHVPFSGSQEEEQEWHLYSQSFHSFYKNGMITLNGTLNRKVTFYSHK